MLFQHFKDDSDTYISVTVLSTSGFVTCYQQGKSGLKKGHLCNNLIILQFVGMCFKDIDFHPATLANPIT